MKETGTITKTNKVALVREFDRFRGAWSDFQAIEELKENFVSPYKSESTRERMSRTFDKMVDRKQLTNEFQTAEPGEVTVEHKIRLNREHLTSDNLKEYAKEIQEMNLQPGDKIRNKVTNDQFIVSKVLENFVVEVYPIETNGLGGTTHDLVWKGILTENVEGEEWQIDENCLLSKEYFEVI